MRIHNLRIDEDLAVNIFGTAFVQYVTHALVDNQAMEMIFSVAAANFFANLGRRPASRKIEVKVTAQALIMSFFANRTAPYIPLLIQPGLLETAVPACYYFIAQLAIEKFANALRA